jgi:hypothetical protein
MAQAVSRLPLTAEIRVLGRVSPCGLSWLTKSHWDRIFSEFFGIPLSISNHHFSILICHSPMRCAIALTKQNIIIPSVLK